MCKLRLTKKSNLEIFVAHGKNPKLINIGPLIKAVGLGKISKINKRKAYVYTGL